MLDPNNLPTSNTGWILLIAGILLLGLFTFLSKRKAAKTEKQEEERESQEHTGEESQDNANSIAHGRDEKDDFLNRPKRN